MFSLSENINNHFLLIAFFGVILVFSGKGFYLGVSTFLFFVIITLINLWFVKVRYKNKPADKDRRSEFRIISFIVLLWLMTLFFYSAITDFFIT